MIGLYEEVFMKELVIVALYICASISDIQNRTIPNRIPALLILLWPIWLAINKDYPEMLVSGLWSELFVIGILVMVNIATKFTGNMSSIGGGDIKLILSTCLYLEIKEIVIFLLSANILGVLFSLLFILWNNLSMRRHNNTQENNSSNNIFTFTFPFAPFLTFGIILALCFR